MAKAILGHLEGTGRSPLQHEDADGSALAHERDCEEGGEVLLTQARHRLEACALGPRVGRDRPQVLGREARDALAEAEAHVAHSTRRKADVRAHDEHILAVGGLAQVDADHVGGDQHGHLAAQGVEQLGERSRRRGELEHAQQAGHVRVGAVDLQTDG